MTATTTARSTRSLAPRRTISRVAARRLAALGVGLALPLGASAGFAATASQAAASTTPSYRLAVSTHTLSFGSVNVGASGSLSVKLTNTGSKSLTPVKLLSGSPAFSVAAGTCASLAPAKSCTYTLTFAPTAAGAAAGQLQILTTQGTPAQNVALTGTGVQQMMESYFYLYTFTNPPAINGIAAPQSFTGAGYAPAGTYVTGQTIPVYDTTGLVQIGTYRIGTTANLNLDPAQVNHVNVSSYTWGTQRFTGANGLASYDGTTGLGSERGALLGWGLEGSAASFNDHNPAIVPHHF